VLVFVALVVAQKLGQSPKEQTAAVQQPTAPAVPAPAPPPVENAAPPAVEPPKETPKETHDQDNAARPETAPPVVAAAAPPKTPEVNGGTVAPTTSPAGATAIFDGIPALTCTSPCTLTLPAGRHTFVARHSGYRDAQRIIDIPRDTGLIVDLAKMAGMLSVISTPPGLTVMVDGLEQPQKTPASLTLSVGQHRVQVIKGNDKQEFTVDIRDGLLSSKIIDWTQ